MNLFIAACSSKMFRAVIIVALTLLVMYIALFKFAGFGMLLLITLLVMDRVAHYFKAGLSFMAMRALQRTFGGVK